MWELMYSQVLLWGALRSLLPCSINVVVHLTELNAQCFLSLTFNDSVKQVAPNFLSSVYSKATCEAMLGKFLSLTGQIVNILGFGGYLVSDATTSFCA